MDKTGKSPAFQFYPADWLSSRKIMLMTPAQEGAYIRLLAIAWGEPDCGLPDDDDQLATLSRLNEGWFTGGSSVLRECFVSRDGRLYNERLLQERKKQELWREKSAAGGRKSGKARQRKKLDAAKGGSQMVGTKREPNSNSSSSSSSSSSKDIPPVVPQKSGDGKADSTTKEKDPRHGEIVALWIDLYREHVHQPAEQDVAAKVGRWVKGTARKPGAWAHVERMYGQYDAFRFIPLAFRLYLTDRDNRFASDAQYPWAIFVKQQQRYFVAAVEYIKEHDRGRQSRDVPGRSGLTRVGDILRPAQLATEGERHGEPD